MSWSQLHREFIELENQLDEAEKKNNRSLCKELNKKMNKIHLEKKAILQDAKLF